MKTFKQFLSEQNHSRIQQAGKDYVFENFTLTLNESIKMVDMWQKLQQCNVSGSLSSELLLSRIKMLEQQLSEAKISDIEYKSMMKVLFGVKLIIGDLLIDNDA